MFGENGVLGLKVLKVMFSTPGAKGMSHDTSFRRALFIR